VSKNNILGWDLDNSKFILDWIIPNLKLCDFDKRVMRWAYLSGAEKDSDGETLVFDMFLNGLIKDPAGVTHDYLNRVHDHTTPDGTVWSAGETNALYRRIKQALGAGFRQRWRRWLGVTLSKFFWWRKRK